MEALVNIDKKVGNNLPNKLQKNSNDELIVLLKQKIEESIMENGKIVYYTGG